jgi:glycosyltransferase involved in cell wall biosynthesis
MKIGMIPLGAGTWGGIHQYSLSLQEALPRARPMDELSLLIAWPGDADEAGPPIGWKAESLVQVNALRRFKGRVRSTLGANRARQLGDAYTAWMQPSQTRPRTDVDEVTDRPHVRQWLSRLGLDLLIFGSPDPRSFEIGLPYVLAVHDLQHRLQPEFPEVSVDGEYERREYAFRNGVRYAAMVLVDSEVGREEVLNAYGDWISPERIAVLPFVPPPYLDRPTAAKVDEVRSRYGVPGRYLLFPAQFWPHKNHVRVIEAMSALRRAGVAISILLTGSAGDPIRSQVATDVRQAVERGGLTDAVMMAGHVPDADMAGLYAGSVGVVLPTFFGPTNIPVLEAWKLDVPILTSDIRGIREQVGDAALLVEPRSVDSIADGLKRLWTDEVLRQQLVQAGRRRVDSYGPTQFAERLADAIGRVDLRNHRT